MGFFDRFRGKKQVQTNLLVTLMPKAAIDEVMHGRLPQLVTQKLIFKQGELLHWYDPAILIKETTQRQYVRRNRGVSFPLFWGMRYYSGGGVSDVVENTYTEEFKGTLYISNKRTIFQAPKNSFDMPHSKLSTMDPYANAIVLQYDTKLIQLYVPNGGLIARVIRQVTA